MPITIALIGAGHMGRIHIQKLASFENTQISGVADVDPEKARELGQQYKVPSFDNYQKLIGHADGVIIATPTDTHYQIAKDFLNAGTHVLIEKPITSNLDEAKELIDLGKKNKLILQVGFLERFNPAFLKSFPLIKKPLLIESCRASGFTGRSTDIDVILDLMIHDIDLILSIVNEEILDIRAQGVPFIMDKLDVAGARIEFANGCIANLHANRISAKKERTLTIFEKDRNFFVDLLNRRVVINMKIDGGNIDTKEYLADQTDAVKHEITAFIQSITEGTNPTVKGEDGLKALALADQIKRYIADNKA